MAWLVLGVAVLTEIVWALSLKWAGVQAAWQAASLPVALSFVNMGLLALAMRGLPAATAYAVWTGLGAVGVALCGAMLFGERMSPAQIGFMGLIVIGVVGTKLVAGGLGLPGGLRRPPHGADRRGRARPQRQSPRSSSPTSRAQARR